jgi:hypothetical protein
MAFALNNVTTADGYTPATTMSCQGSRALELHALNANIYYEIGLGAPSVVWQGEIFMSAGHLLKPMRLDAIRVRSAKAGTPAQVSVVA